ncbi:hypothetical protein KI387_025125, partial [Taxus chinensis]
PTPYKDIPRKGYVPNKSRLAGALTRIAIEVAPATNSKCDVIEERDDEVKVIKVDKEDPESRTSKLDIKDPEGEINNHFF